MEYKDYYNILGVDKSATSAEIKQAYRKLAKQHHPDLHPDDAVSAEKFKEINEAYEVLGDVEKRKKYDMFGSNYNFAGGQNFDPSDFGFGNFSYDRSSSGNSAFYDLIFGQGSPFADLFGGGGVHFSQGPGFSDFSGGQGGYYSTGRPRRARYDTDLELSLDEAYRGGEKTVGFRLGDRSHDVLIKWPQGIMDGKIIKVRGDKFGIEGDLYVGIHIRTEARLEGADIVQKLLVSPWDAYFGSKKRQETPAGTIQVTIPQGVSSGQRIRIPGKGLKDKDRRGELYLEIQLQNPRLNEQQEALYRQMKDLEEV